MAACHGEYYPFSQCCDTTGLNDDCFQWIDVVALAITLAVDTMLAIILVVMLYRSRTGLKTQCVLARTHHLVEDI